MKVFKLLPVLCAFAAASGLTVRADDNPAQAAARAALASHSFDMAATNAPATNVMMTPVNPGQSAKDAKAKAKAEKAAADAKAKQDAADAKAKKEAEKKLAEQQAAQAKADKAAADAKAKQDAAAKASADKMAMDSAPKNSDNQTEAQKAAMAQIMAAEVPTNTMTMAQSPTNAPATKAKPVAKVKKQKKKKAEPATQTAAAQPAMDENYPGKDIGMKPITVPPPPVSASKVEKLQALLAKYRADQISPEEYQQQRAAIIADP
jgi:hypothetical protein